MAIFDLDKISNDPNFQVRLTAESGGSGSIVGFITDDMEVSGEASFNTPFETTMDKQSTQLNVITTAANSWFGLKMPQMQLKSRAQTVNMWVSSKRPSWTFTFIYVALREGESVINNVKFLIGACYPEVGSSMRSLMSAPNNYAVDLGGSPSGTFLLEYSSWFKAPELVLTNASASMSKEITPDGEPLYAKVSVTLEPYKMISSEDFRGYFI